MYWDYAKQNFTASTSHDYCLIYWGLQASLFLDAYAAKQQNRLVLLALRQDFETRRFQINF
jgi:hypothetical protein